MEILILMIRDRDGDINLNDINKFNYRNYIFNIIFY